MPPSPLADLAVVPLSALVLHEAVEPRRAEAVRDGIARTGVLNDPIVAAPTPDGRWLVLDGAHRTTALADLGIGAAVVQRMTISGLDGVGERAAGSGRAGYADAGALVDAWAHDIRGSDPATPLDPGVLDPRVLGVEVGGVEAGAFQAGAFQAGALQAGASQAGALQAGAFQAVGRAAVVAVIEGAGQRIEVRAAPDLPGRLAAMWGLAGRYAGLEYVRRHPADPGPAAGVVRVTWAPALASDLADLAVLGATFPAGVSRFIVRGRVLGLHVPLSELARTAPDGRVVAAAALDLLARLRRLPVRRYSEPVWVVESTAALGVSGVSNHEH